MGMRQAAIDAPSACVVVGANQRMLDLALSIDVVAIATAELLLGSITPIGALGPVHQLR